MRKLQIREAEVMQISIRQEISRSEKARYDHRLHGVLLVANGQSCGAVAELFGENPRTVQRWMKRFEAGGFDALRKGERAERPRALDSRQWRPWSAICATTRATTDMSKTSGTASSCVSTSDRATGFLWGYANVSASLARWGFDCVSPVC